MPYIDLAGLSRYASCQKERLERDYALLRDMQWTRSEKAGAVSLWPAPSTPLEPAVDFLFTEVPPAGGDKGPDNPSTISGVSSVKVTRANSNLIRWPYYDSSGRESGGVTWTVNADGSISASGTTTSFSTFRLQLIDRYPTEAMLVPRGSYRYSGCPSGGGGNTYRLDVAIYTPHASRATKTSDYGNGGTLVVTEPALCSFYCAINTGQTVSNLQFKPKLQLDGVDEPFEKNAQDVYTLPLGSTYYGGTLDAASGVMTVTWDSFTFNGTEVWQSSEGYLLQNTAGFYIGKADQQAIGFDCYSGDINPIACEIFSTVNSFTVDSQSIYKSLGSFMIRVDNSRLFSYGYTPGTSTRAEAISAFKSWLSDNNVTVFYRREAPYTVQLDPVSISALVQQDKYTPRLNTLYTDAQAVQAGYIKSPIRDEYELTQAITAQGGNV